MGLAVIASAILATLAAPAGLETVGLYTDLTENPEMVPFLKACGYNTYEILDNGFAREPSAHEAFYAKLAAHIGTARQGGFRTYVILLSNMEQKTGPGEPKYTYGLFPPRDEALMRERLEYIRAAVKHLKGADGFVFFAADPGGEPNKQSDVDDCIAMARKVKAIVHEEAPAAEFIFNPWAIAAWDKFPSPMEVEFWDKETAADKRVVALPDLLGPTTGVEFPLHNYYRSLTLHCYANAGREPELYPTAGVVSDLRQRGVKRLWGWPYFLIDECDDGYSGHTWGQAQAETRYLHKIVSVGRKLGLNGMVGNASMKGLHPEMLNLYAFGRFCADPKATPEAVLGEFAGFVAEPAMADDLGQVLRFVENHSSWQEGTPVRYRLPNLPCDLDSPQAALDRLAKVKPLTKSTFPLPEAPSAYLARLGERLKVLAAKEVKP